MEQVVRVLTTHDDGSAKVVRVRESACSGDCHKCSGCGAAKETLIITAVNAIGACPGDMVVIRSESGPVLRAAVAFYVLPMVLFFLGYVAGGWIHAEVLCGCLAFVLGICAAVVYDRKVAKKENTVYTITGFAG